MADRLASSGLSQGNKFGNSIQQSSEAVQLCEEEEWDNPGAWYYRKELYGGSKSVKQISILSYLLCDCHIPDLPPPPEEALDFKEDLIQVLQPPMFKMPPISGSLVLIKYQFGPWQVHVPWPFAWYVEGGAPMPNRYGFAPSAEFGTPTFQGETPVNDKIGTVDPFPYRTIKSKDSDFTPKAPFVFGKK